MESTHWKVPPPDIIPASLTWFCSFFTSLNIFEMLTSSSRLLPLSLTAWNFCSDFLLWNESKCQLYMKRKGQVRMNNFPMQELYFIHFVQIFMRIKCNSSEDLIQITIPVLWSYSSPFMSTEFTLSHSLTFPFWKIWDIYQV